jgi:polar amino acid transport system substrate-binding protein
MVLSCAAWSTVRAQDLTIYAEDAAPFNFERNGELTGSSTKIVIEILDRLGIDAPIRIIPWARGYKKALTEPNVVLYSVVRSVEREKRFYWVGPLATVRSSFYAPKEATIVVRDIDDARELRRIGVRRADARETYLQKLGLINLESTNSNQSNLKKLLDGRIDLWATSNIEARGVTEQLGIAPDAIKHIYTFQQVNLYVAISKQTPMEVAHTWQRTLDQMKTDGTFAAISRRWLPETSLPEEVTRPTAARSIKEKMTIFSENSPPGNYIENGQLKGPAVKVVQEILRRLSLDAEIKMVPWARGYQLARTQPNVALFSTTRLPQREKLFKWVGPLYTQRWGFYAPRDTDLVIASMHAARAVARIGTYHKDAKEQYLLSRGFRNLVSTNNNIGNVRHLLEKRIDLWVSSDFNMPYIVRYAGYNPLQIKRLFSFKTVGNYIAFSRQTPDHIVHRWQAVLDDIRQDGTWARYFGPVQAPID